MGLFRQCVKSPTSLTVDAPGAVSENVWFTSCFRMVVICFVITAPLLWLFDAATVGDKVPFTFPHDEHGAGSATNDMLGHTAQQHVFQSGASVGGDDNEIRS